MVLRVALLVTVGSVWSLGCGIDPRSESKVEIDRPELCGRPGNDAVRDLFCAGVAPQISSLQQLQLQLELEFGEGPDALDELNTISSHPTYRDRGLVLLNSSTALSGKLVTTLNPRAIVLGPTTIMAFSRGVQQLELISRDRDDEQFNFYLLSFEQACNARAEGCGSGDLYTPRLESDWTSVRIEDDEQLKNTASDCRQCHQRARAEPILLMRELQGPWTHFFMADQDQPDGLAEPNGVDLVRTYYRAKGDERYAGIPWEAIRATQGLTLEEAVHRPQPLVFDGNEILNERWPWTMEGGYPAQPLPSTTWYRAYEAFKRGEHLSLPYFEPIPGDPARLERLSAAYQSYRRGEIPAQEVPDLSAIAPDDARIRAEMGLQTEPGASPAQALIQACGSCHNDVLDQSISRARFTIALSRLDPTARALASERIALPLDAPGHMPPREFRQLGADAVGALIDYLRADSRPAADDALLERAAQLGMAQELTERASSSIGLP